MSPTVAAALNILFGGGAGAISVKYLEWMKSRNDKQRSANEVEVSHEEFEQSKVEFQTKLMEMQSFLLTKIVMLEGEKASFEKQLVGLRAELTTKDLASASKDRRIAELEAHVAVQDGRIAELEARQKEAGKFFADGAIAEAKKAGS